VTIESGNSTRLIIASGIIGGLAAIIWLGAPIVPAVVGAAGAVFLLWYRRS
jgi:hypothetical protein